MRKKILLLILISIVTLSQIKPLFADELDLPTTTINPDSFYYSIKRLWEKGREKLSFSQEAKINFADSLTKTRLAELKYIVDNQILTGVEHSSERFSYQAGILTDLIIKQNSQDVKTKTAEQFQKYNKLLKKLRDKYQANSSFWLLIQHDINSLNILSERLLK